MKKILLSLLFLITSVTVFSQDIIVTNDGSAIKCYNVDITDTYIYYLEIKDDDNSIKRIKVSDVIAVRKENGEKIAFDSKSKDEETDSKSKDKETDVVEEVEEQPDLQFCDQNLPDIDLTDFHGFLMAEGNVVYVDSPNTHWEIAGANKLRELLSIDGFWKLAARKEQAHFIIRYAVQLKGRDHVIFKVFDTREGLPESILDEQDSHWRSNFGGDTSYSVIFSSEKGSTNSKAAIALYNKVIKPSQVKISKSKNFKKGVFAPFVIP